MEKPVAKTTTKVKMPINKYLRLPPAAGGMAEGIEELASIGGFEPKLLLPKPVCSDETKF